MYRYYVVCEFIKVIKIFNGHQFCSGFTLNLRQVTVDLDVAYIMKTDEAHRTCDLVG